MNARVTDPQICVARIRSLQAIHNEAHQALVNWGRWSRDRYKIFPKPIESPSIWDEAVPSKFGDFADEGEGERIETTGPAKAERAEKEPYDELKGHQLDERIHARDGLAQYLRDALKMAYVSREVPEDQFPRLTGCSEDTFCERLESCLIFVSRNS